MAQAFVRRGERHFWLKHNLLLVAFLFGVVPFVSADTHFSTSTETFDSYSAGALDGANGGYGWAGTWGAGSLLCESDIAVSTSSVIDGVGSLQINVDLTDDDTCQREFSNPITGTESLSFKLRSTRTDNRLIVQLTQDTVGNEPGIQIYFGSNGYIRVTDNTTATNLQAYSADTTYLIEVFPDVASETFTVSVNGGTPHGPYHFNSYGSVTYTALRYFHVQDGQDVSSGTMYVDSIMPPASEDFESYSAGALDGANGGYGWAGTWGAGSLLCKSDIVVSTSSVMDGVGALQINVDLTDDDTCQREFANPITGTEPISFKLRSSRTDNRLIVSLTQDTVGNEPGIQIYFGSNGYIKVTDNVTATNLQTYAANTTYRIDVFPDVASETFTLSVDDAPYGPYHFNSYGSVAYTQLKYFHVQDGQDVSSGTMYVDSIRPAIVPTPETSLPSATSTETFDSYSAGALDGANGGAGWAGAWGAGSLLCKSDIVVSTSSVIDGIGSLQINVDLTDDDTCQREFSQPITSTQSLSFKMRSSRTDNRLIVQLTQDTAGNEPAIQVYFGSNGYFRVTDNTTATNLQTYLADTTYLVEVFPDVASESFTVSINGGAPYGPYKFNSYQSVAYTQLKYFHVQDGQDVSSGTMYVDSIMPPAREDFESYSAGSLDGASGGYGWAGTWGAGSLLCQSDIGVSTSSVMDGVGSLQINVDLTDDDTCQRELGNTVTATESYSFKVRSTRTDNRLIVGLQQDTAGNEAGVAIQLGSNGYIQAINNTSLTNLQTYAANTTYQIDVSPNVAAETYTVSINGGAPYGPYSFHNAGTVTYTALKYFEAQDGQDVSSGTMYVDSIEFSG
jgi:hypothetical protein